MAAPRPKKKPPVKKAPVKKPKVGTVKSAKETRESISRKKVGTSRPARGDLGARAQYLKYGPTQPQGPEAPRYQQKIGPVKPTASAGSKALALLGKVAKVSGIVGAITSPITSAVPAGAGSDKPSGPLMKSSMPGGYGSKTSGYGPTPKKKSSGFGKRISEGAKFERLRASRAATEKEQKMNTYISAAIATSKMSGGGVNNPSGNSSGGALRRRGAGTYTASYDVKDQKSGPSNTAATTAAASGSNGGGSQAANVAKAGGKAKAKVGKQTKYQRESLAMEQRKRSSGTNVSKPKKSIFSLFRKG